ncbi:MAG: hypothetical protein SFU25_07155 [Candidatus Caenarcaniphilales bacterium]|nr:hypothetical protein [Candidatus Caenarcaniphilales bacterium]
MDSNLTHNDSNLLRKMTTYLPKKLIIRSKKNEIFPEIANDLLNQDCETSVLINFKNFSKDKKWLQYSLELKNPLKTLDFKSDNFLLCLSPMNELNKLHKDLKTFLTSPEINFYRFEPVEPCFELTVEKDTIGESKGIKLHLWVDSGNAEFAYYTWDAFGIRLYTTQEEINNFVEGLEELLNGLNE